MPFRLLLLLLFSVFCGQNTVGILKSGRKTAGAFISHGFGDTGDIRLRTSQHDLTVDADGLNPAVVEHLMDVPA